MQRNLPPRIVPLLLYIDYTLFISYCKEFLYFASNSAIFSH
nr:MAG TPA: hypothetical protein [Caudoviricetes sp.]